MVLSHGEEKKKKGKVLLPRPKAQRSHRNAIAAPTGAAELLDVMTGRRWRLMPLRSKEYRSMEQKVCTIKVEIALGRNDGSTLCGNVGKEMNPKRNVGFFFLLLCFWSVIYSC